MQVVFTPNGWTDFSYWSENDRKTLAKVIKLINAIGRNPYAGIGKPEQLKHELSGCWSRRISKEHRIVYEIDEENDHCIILSCRRHY